jgi:hypothetical protein
MKLLQTEAYLLEALTYKYVSSIKDYNLRVKYFYVKYQGVGYRVGSELSKFVELCTFYGWDYSVWRTPKRTIKAMLAAVRAYNETQDD